MNMTKRLPLADALKGIAAQVILLHHLTSYGPIGRALREEFPLPGAWLYDYGRMAVQVFLVIAGFLAARSLAPAGYAPTLSPGRLIMRRYGRLVPPFLVAMTLSLVVARLAARWLDDDMLPDLLGGTQWLAHAVLLHGVLEVPSLSAGAWYVAIDFQLFALFVLLLGWGGRYGVWLVGALALASLLYFNRVSAWDAWGMYFFAAYGLGALVQWLGVRRSVFGTLAVAAVVLGGLVFDFRARLLVALLTAGLLLAAVCHDRLMRWPASPGWEWLGKVSYSVFLVHFSLLVLANALVARLAEEGGGLMSGAAATAGVVLATWAACVAGGVLFYRGVELPAGKLAINWRVLAGRGNIPGLRGWRAPRHS